MLVRAVRSEADGILAETEPLLGSTASVLAHKRGNHKLRGVLATVACPRCRCANVKDDRDSTELWRRACS